MDMFTFSVIAVLAFFTAIISAIAGFGSGILIIVGFSFFFDIKTAVAMGGILFLFSGINKTILFHKTVDWDFAKKVLMGAIPGCLLGLYFFKMISPLVIQYLMAALGAYMVADHLFKFRKGEKWENFTFPKIVLGGSLFGFVSGIASAAMIKVLLLRLRGLSKEYFVGTGVILTLTMQLIKAPAFVFMDFLSWKDFLVLAPIFFLNFAGTVIGKKILGKISRETFEKVVMVLISLSVVKFLFF